MIGVDLIEIERVERALERRPRLAERLFTPAELAHCRAAARPGRHLAARFAAKEATLKALRLSYLTPREAEVTGGGDGPPRLVLHGRTAEVARERGVELALTLSHSRELAIAMVMASPRT